MWTLCEIPRMISWNVFLLVSNTAQKTGYLVDQEPGRCCWCFVLPGAGDLPLLSFGLEKGWGWVGTTTPVQQSPISRDTVSILYINRGLTVITQPFCPSTRLSALIDELAGDWRPVKKEDRPLTKIIQHLLHCFETTARQDFGN